MPEPKDKNTDPDKRKSPPEQDSEPITQEAWDKFYDLMDKALGQDKKPPKQQAG